MAEGEPRARRRRRSELWRAFLLVLCIQLPPVMALYGLWAVTHVDGLYDAEGMNAAGDYPAYYLASSMANRGEAAAAYEQAELTARSAEILGFVSDDLPWFYPPTFFLVLAPFALLALWPSVLAWVAFNAAAIAAWGYGFARRGWFALAALAFPSSLLALFAGQNGGLTAGLLGGGLLLLERRPVLAGVLLGAAGFKPQLGLLVPVALIAGRHWRTFGAAAATYVGLALASLWAYGAAPWRAHLAALGRAGEMVEQGVMPLEKMVTPLSMFYLFGLPAPLPTVLMSAFMGFSVVLVFWLWRVSENSSLRISVLVIAIYLAAPYAYFHDAALLALPLLLWVREAQSKGWHFGEALALAAFWLSPYLLWTLAVYAKWHLWPLLLLALLGAVFWRFRGGREIA